MSTTNTVILRKDSDNLIDQVENQIDRVRHQQGWVAPEDLAEEYYCLTDQASKNSHTSVGSTTSSQQKGRSIIYLDVGCWCGGSNDSEDPNGYGQAWEKHRDFGIVHGSYVLLCALKSAEGAGDDKGRNTLAGDDGERIENLLKAIESTSEDIIVRRILKANTSFESISILVGDMHIPPIERKTDFSKFNHAKEVIGANDLDFCKGRIPLDAIKVAADIVSGDMRRLELLVRKYAPKPDLASLDKLGDIVKREPEIAAIVRACNRVRFELWLHELFRRKISGLNEGASAEDRKHAESLVNWLEDTQFKEWTKCYLGGVFTSENYEAGSSEKPADIFQNAADDFEKFAAGIVKFREENSKCKIVLTQVGDLVDLWMGFQGRWTPSDDPDSPVEWRNDTAFVDYWIKRILSQPDSRVVRVTNALRRLRERDVDVVVLNGNHDNYLSKRKFNKNMVGGYGQRRNYEKIFVEHGHQYDDVYNGNNAKVVDVSEVADSANWYRLDHDHDFSSVIDELDSAVTGSWWNAETLWGTYDGWLSDHPEAIGDLRDLLLGWRAADFRILLGEPCTFGSALTQAAFVAPERIRRLEGKIVGWLSEIDNDKDGQRIEQMKRAVDCAIFNDCEVYVHGHTHNPALTKITVRGGLASWCATGDDVDGLVLNLKLEVEHEARRDSLVFRSRPRERESGENELTNRGALTASWEGPDGGPWAALASVNHLVLVDPFAPTRTKGRNCYDPKLAVKVDSKKSWNKGSHKFPVVPPGAYVAKWLGTVGLSATYKQRSVQMPLAQSRPAFVDGISFEIGGTYLRRDTEFLPHPFDASTSWLRAVYDYELESLEIGIRTSFELWPEQTIKLLVDDVEMKGCSMATERAEVHIVYQPGGSLLDETMSFESAAPGRLLLSDEARRTIANTVQKKKGDVLVIASCERLSYKAALLVLFTGGQTSTQAHTWDPSERSGGRLQSGSSEDLAPGAACGVVAPGPAPAVSSPAFTPAQAAPPGQSRVAGPAISPPTPAPVQQTPVKPK